MVKHRKRRKQSLFSKAINMGLITLGFSRLLVHLFFPQSAEEKMKSIIKEATFGLSEGAFDLDAGFRMYMPVGAAVALGKLKNYLFRKFPVR